MGSKVTFAFGVLALIIGYAMIYSGISMFNSSSDTPGVGLFQALGVPNSVSFDLSQPFQTGALDLTPDNAAPTQTGNTPQTNTPQPIQTVQMT